MKKLFLLILFVATCFSSFSQANGQFPNKQSQGSPTTLWSQGGAVQGVKGIINGVFYDTLTANNSTYIEFYPGAQIFTTKDNSLWVRNSIGNKWLAGAGNIDITNIYDSSIVISNIYQDSLLVLCYGNGACDTINLGDQYYSFYFISDTTLVVCDEPQVVCVADTCTTQQVCDTIAVPRQRLYLFQNGVQQVSGGIVEHGSASSAGSTPSILLHDTYLYSDYLYQILGARLANEILSVKQRQGVPASGSVASFWHSGNGVNPAIIDYDNQVKLWVNYTNPFYGDSAGYMGDRIGYYFATNARGSSNSIGIQNVLSKQSGVMLHTLDVGNTDAVTIFGTQTPKAIPLFQGTDPSSFYDNRIAVFKTSGQVQNPFYTNNGVFEVDDTTNYKPGVFDANGNFYRFNHWPGGGGGGLLFARTDAANASGGQLYFDNAAEAFEIDNSSSFNINTTSFNVNTIGLVNRLTLNTLTSEIRSPNSSNYVQLDNSQTDIFVQTGDKIRLLEGINQMGIDNGTSYLNAPKAVITVTDSLTIVGLAAGATTDRILVQRSSVGSNRVGYVAASNFTYTASNGLTLSGSDFQLGGTLTGNTTIAMASQTFAFTNSGNNQLSINPTTKVYSFGNDDGVYNWKVLISGDQDLGTAKAVLGSVSDNTNIEINDNHDFNVQFGGTLTYQISEGSSMYHLLDAGTPANTVYPQTLFSTVTSGTAADGFGQSHLFYIETASGASQLANQLTSKWTTAANATRTSQFIITGVNSAVTSDLAQFNGNGGVVLPGTGTPTNTLQVINTTGTGIRAETSSGISVWSIASTSGIGVQANSVDALSIVGVRNSSTTNTVIPVFQSERQTTGTAADGIGSSFDFYLETDAGSTNPSNKLISKWTTAASGTRTSQFTIQGINSGTTADKLVIEGDGRIYGTGLHNAAGAVTGTTNQYIASGTYTATLFNTTNVGASTVYTAQWTRVGNVVTVSGKVDIDPTTTVATELGMSLPIASAFTVEEDLGGIAASDVATTVPVRIRADATNDRASFVFTAVSISNDSYSFTFTYLIK